MFHYNKDNNILTIKRRDIKPLPDNDILKDIKESYAKYKAVGGTIEQDVQYLFDRLAADSKMPYPIETHTTVGELVDIKNSYDLKPRDLYYPVYVQVKTTGGQLSEPIELIRIPYMDSRGVLNFDASLKVLINFLSPSEDVSYDVSDSGRRKLNVYLGKRNLPFEITNSDLVMLKIGKAKADITDIILALLRAENPNSTNEELLSHFDAVHNAALTYKLKCRDGYEAATAYANAKCINTVIYSKDYEMSSLARHNFNKAMQLDRAIGETLSRDVKDAVTGEILVSAGTQLTKEHIKILKKHLVWKIYVRRKPYVRGLELAESDVLYITEGCRVGKLIETKLGSMLGGAKYVPKGMGISKELLGNVNMSNPEECARITEQLSRYMVNTSEFKNKLNDDIIEFYFDMHRTDPLKIKKTNEVITIEFDTEIITNQTFLEADFKEGGSTNVWYTFDNNNELVRQTSCLDTAILNDEADVPGYYCYRGDRMNSRDFMALYSIAGWYIAHPGVRILLNKDDSLLKVVDLFNEVYSAKFREAADSYYNLNKTTLKKMLTPINVQNLKTSHFYSFRKVVREKLFSSKCVEAADTLNPAAVLAHVSNISTVVNDKNSVSEKQRLLTLPFYGRICPYETPSSAKIGLVNHKAMGCRIKDRQLLTAFRKVHRRGEVAYIDFDEEPVWLSPKEQAEYKITDILSVPMYNDGTFKEGNVLAMIPNVSRTGDAITVESIPANNLEYVSYFPEQHCSATAMLMPFLGADDPARISFGLSMQKQTIFCQENQKPRVLTRQYKEMFESMPYYTVIAEKDGIVQSITDNAIAVKYKVDPATFQGRADTFTTSPQAILDLQLRVGQTFKKGVEMIMPEVTSVPDTPVIKAPYYCEVTAIDPSTGMFVVKELYEEGSYGAKTLIYCQSIIINGQSVTFMEYDKIPGQSFKAGDMLAHASIIKDGFYAPSRNVLVAYMPTGYNYEDAVDMSQDCASHYTSISMHKQDIENVYTPGRERYDLITERSYVHEGGRLAKLVARSTVNLDDPENSRQAVDYHYADKASGYVYSFYAEHEDVPSSTKRKKKTTYHLSLLSFNNEKPGDKMAGRHGNKGVAPRIGEDSRMPMLRNGKVVDVCLNPCGVPSRMNLGQNLEAHLGFVAELLNIYIISDPFNGASLEDITMLMKFAYDIANSDPAIWTRLVYNYNLPSSLSDHLLENIDHIKEWEGAFNRDGTADMWDPETQRWYEFPIAFGYSYFLKLEQEVDEKIHVREGMTSETYNECAQQPQQGRANGGGQKFGEMELVTLAAYGATEFLHEAVNEKSDNVGARYNMTAEVLGTSARRAPKRECAARANDIIRYELEAAGIYTKVEGEEEGIYPIDFETSNQRERFSGNAVTRDARLGRAASKENTVEKVVTTLDDLIAGLEDIN